MPDQVFNALLRHQSGKLKSIKIKAVTIEEAATNIATTPKNYECISISLHSVGDRHLQVNKNNTLKVK